MSRRGNSSSVRASAAAGATICPYTRNRRIDTWKGDEIEAKEAEFNPYFARAYPFMDLTVLTARFKHNKNTQILLARLILAFIQIHYSIIILF